MKKLLQSNKLGAQESEILQAVLAWGHGPSDGAGERTLEELETLLPLVRFPQMEAADLDNVRGHPLFARSSLLRSLVAEAEAVRQQGPAVECPGLRVDPRNRLLLAEAQEDEQRVRLQRRLHPNTRELLYEFDGDSNGVFYHVGTDGGASAWLNPVLGGRVAVKASSPACSHTNPKALLSRQYQRVSFAGPKREAGATLSYWLVDLGPGTRLLVTHYTIRTDGSAEFPRTWALQGSQDGVTWTELRCHVEDRRVKQTGSFYSWPVQLQAGQGDGFRLLRLVLTARTSAGTWNLAICNLELYGYLSTSGS